MLLDSNIIIHAAGPEGGKIRSWMEGHALSTSVICRIEVLGWHKLAEPQRGWMNSFFGKLTVHGMDPHVVESAIQLRQQRKMELADAIIAATALCHRIPLVTRNIDDFRHIAGLHLIDPLSL